MVDRSILRTTNILQHDRKSLHQYGFSDPEINRLRQWVMSSPWEINEVNAAYEKLTEIKESISEIKKNLSRLTASLPDNSSLRVFPKKTSSSDNNKTSTELNFDSLTTNTHQLGSKKQVDELVLSSFKSQILSSYLIYA